VIAYLAIIKDGFREALASKVLWILLVVISLVLVSLAPFGYDQQLTTGFKSNDVLDWQLFAGSLLEGKDSEKKTPARRIWNHLSESSREQMVAMAAGEIEGEAKQKLFENCTDDVKEMLDDVNFYDKDTWRGTRLLPEAFGLLIEESRSESETKRLNRLLLESTFPGVVRASEHSTLQFSWGYVNLPMGKFPMRIEVFHRVVSQLLDGFIKYIFGPIGIFVGVLITAPIVPRTFESGTLQLLLSKPVSRTFLLIAKFIGGCAFVFICSAYLLTGMWLIVGLRFGYWYPGMLWYIPAFVFVFAIYYSISVLAGLVYRNTIVSISVSVMFWLLCFTLGTAKVGIEEFLLTEEIDRIVPAGDIAFVVNKNIRPKYWQGDDWKTGFLAKNQREFRALAREFTFVGPVYDEENEQIFAAQAVIEPGVNPFMARFSGQTVPTTVHLNVGKRSGDWEHEQGVALPNGIIELGWGEDDKLVVVTSVGIYRLEGDPLKPSETKILGFNLSLGEGPVKRVSSSDWPSVSPPWHASVSKADSAVALVTRGKLFRFTVDDEGKYQLSVEKKLGEKKLGEKATSHLIASTEKHVTVVDEVGQITIFAPDSLVEIVSLQPTGDSTSPRSIASSPNGRWTAVLFHNREVAIVDHESGKLISASIRGQGDVSAISFSPDSKLFVADRTNRVTVYSLDPLQQDAEFAPSLSVFDKVYRYGILPAHYVLPKPGELDRTVKYLVTGDDSEVVEEQVSPTGVGEIRKKLYPWRPIWSGLGFIVVVMGIACFFFERKEL
jgi:hypothetical protein